MNIRDTLLVVLSDMHTGGSTALFAKHQWGDEFQTHTPSALQRSIYRVFEQCMDYAGTRRSGKRLIVVHDGDAIEGFHHNTIQLSLMNINSQADLHVELMDTFLKAAKFDRSAGDRLFYVRGTESHTGQVENEIAKDLAAEPADARRWVHDHLELSVNGRKVWFVHHGRKRGGGANEGNSLRNFLRDVHFDYQKVGRRSPDLLVSGHTHTPTYNTYVAREGGAFRTLHGIICPSWQAKTRYAYKVAPVERNEVGAVFVEISAAGDIREPQFILRETEKVGTVKL